MGIGDELLVTGQCRYLQQRDPRKVRVIYEKPRWHDIWNGNPRIAQPGEHGDFQQFMPRQGYKRPYIAHKTEKTWTWQAWGPEWGGRAPLGEIYLTPEEQKFGADYAGRVYIEPHLKRGASQNKAWGWERWLELTKLLVRAGLRVTQLGAPGLPDMPGAEQLRTQNVRMAAAVLGTARAAVLPEGGLHHIAAAMRTPATVVIFGAYISPEITGYDGQISMFTGQHYGCGMRVTCRCCAEAMAKIKPEIVAAKLLEAIK